MKIFPSSFGSKNLKLKLLYVCREWVRYLQVSRHPSSTSSYKDTHQKNIDINNSGKIARQTKPSIVTLFSSFLSFRKHVCFRIWCTQIYIINPIICQSLCLNKPGYSPSIYLPMDDRMFKSFILNPTNLEQVDHQPKISYCWTLTLWTAKISPKKKIIWKQ